MKKITRIVGIFCIVLLACCYTKKTESHLQKKYTLNGTWIEIIKKLNRKELDQIKTDVREKHRFDYKPFSWGSGIKYPNGVWWFDISEEKKVFLPHGGPEEYIILKMTQREDDLQSISILIMSSDYYIELQSEGIYKEIIYGKAHEVIFHFIDEDIVEFTDPSKTLGTYTVPVHFLLKISGPE
jgi:hypothetical protein